MPQSNRDRDGQPPASFSRQRRRERDFHTLLGLLRGIVADNKLVDSELLCLDIWLKNQGAEIADDPDVVDIVELLNDVLSTQFATSEQIQDLQELINCVLEYRDDDVGDSDYESAMQTLLGMFYGLTADKILNDAEINYLSDWLKSTPVLSGDWTADLITNRLKAILADGIVTNEERLDLLDVINAIIGGGFDGNGAVGGMATRAFSIGAELPDEIIFLESHFVVTGKFLYGTRRVVTEAIQQRGGVVSKDISSHTDYLIVGTCASRDWIHPTHGRKIEHAIHQGLVTEKPKIIAEEYWVMQLAISPLIPA
jgi:hypothetical protein